jgi:hypothetical protein
MPASSRSASFACQGTSSASMLAPPVSGPFVCHRSPHVFKCGCWLCPSQVGLPGLRARARLQPVCWPRPSQAVLSATVARTSLSAGAGFARPKSVCQLACQGTSSASMLAPPVSGRSVCHRGPHVVKCGCWLCPSQVGLPGLRARARLQPVCWPHWSHARLPALSTYARL